MISGKSTRGKRAAMAAGLRERDSERVQILEAAQPFVFVP